MLHQNKVVKKNKKLEADLKNVLPTKTRKETPTESFNMDSLFDKQDLNKPRIQTSISKFITRSPEKETPPARVVEPERVQNVQPVYNQLTNITSNSIKQNKYNYDFGGGGRNHLTSQGG